MQDNPLRLVKLMVEQQLIHQLIDIADRIGCTGSEVCIEALKRYAIEHHIPTEEQLRRPFTDSELSDNPLDTP